MSGRRPFLLALFGLVWLGPAAPADAQTAEPEVFELEIVNGKVAGGHKTLRVTKDDQVELRWTSDAPVELHLHGYDVLARAAPGVTATMAFDAYATGRFSITTHGADSGHDHGHAPLIYLEVHPR